jgi:ferrous iron transport protein A
LGAGGIFIKKIGGKMATLREVEIGSTVKVKKLGGEKSLKRRLMDMGFTRGCEVFVRKVAPLGDPIEVTIRGYELSVRKDDAENIEVE